MVWQTIIEVLDTERLFCFKASFYTKKLENSKELFLCGLQHLLLLTMYNFNSLEVATNSVLWGPAMIS